MSANERRTSKRRGKAQTRVERAATGSGLPLRSQGMPRGLPAQPYCSLTHGCPGGAYGDSPGWSAAKPRVHRPKIRGALKVAQHPGVRLSRSHELPRNRCRCVSCAHSGHDPFVVLGPGVPRCSTPGFLRRPRRGRPERLRFHHIHPCPAEAVWNIHRVGAWIDAPSGPSGATILLAHVWMPRRGHPEQVGRYSGFFGFGFCPGSPLSVILPQPFILSSGYAD